MTKDLSKWAVKNEGWSAEGTIDFCCRFVRLYLHQIQESTSHCQLKSYLCKRMRQAEWLDGVLGLAYCSLFQDSTLCQLVEYSHESERAKQGGGWPELTQVKPSAHSSSQSE